MYVECAATATSSCVKIDADIKCVRFQSATSGSLPTRTETRSSATRGRLMRYTILTAIFAVLAAAPVALGQPGAKETSAVSWQFVSGKNAVGVPIEPAAKKANVRCSVIASD